MTQSTLYIKLVLQTDSVLDQFNHFNHPPPRWWALVPNFSNLSARCQSGQRRTWCCPWAASRPWCLYFPWGSACTRSSTCGDSWCHSQCCHFCRDFILFLPEGCYARTRWIPAPNEVDKGDQQFEDPDISQIDRSLQLSADHASLKMLLLLYASFAEIIVSHWWHLVNIIMKCTVCCDFMVFFCLL